MDLAERESRGHFTTLWVRWTREEKRRRRRADKNEPYVSRPPARAL